MKKLFILFSLLFAIAANAQTDYVDGRTGSQIKIFAGLGNVENTALSTWPGTSNITTLGTIGTGVWNGTIITSGYGGTGNGFTKFSGPASSEKTFTLPNASATILTDNALVTVAQGGTGAGTLTGILKGNGTSAVTAISIPSDASKFLDGTGAFSTPSGVFTYSTITADQTGAVANFYWTNKASTRCVVTLPSSATIGDKIVLVNDPTQNTGWKLAQPATTKIYWGAASTTAGTGGYIQSNSSGDVIEVTFQKNDGTNNLWYVTRAAGQLTVN